MFTAPVYLLVGLLNLFAKKHNYNIKVDHDPDFQIRVKRDLGDVGDIHDREHIINVLKNHRIERMKRDAPKYNFNQLNMPYTNGNPQVLANYSYNSNDYNPYETDSTYDNSVNTVSPIVKRSDHYAYNNPTTNYNYDPFYNVKTENNKPNTNNGYSNNNNPNNGYYNNNNPNTGYYNNYNPNNGYSTNNNANSNAYYNNVQLSYPTNGVNNNYANNGYYNNKNYNSNNNNQNSLSNIQKIEPKNPYNGNKIIPTETVTETSTITILEGNLFRFGSRCPQGSIKIGKTCIKIEDLDY